MKYINNNTDDEIKAKTNNIRIEAIRLGNILTKEERNNIRENLDKIENKKRLSNAQKERKHAYLIELTHILDKLEKYKYHNYHDLYYFGIRNIESLFDNIDDIDYYKPTLTKSSFMGNYEYYEIRGDRHKNLSLKQYLYTIMPELTELINEKKNNNKNEQKIQLSMGVNFMHNTDREKKSRTFYVKSDNVIIRSGDNPNEIITKLYESFLNNYQKEENILRNGSNYTFECVDILGIHFHNMKLKRGSSYIDSPAWIKNKRAIINPKNTKNNRCFQYALHHQDIRKYPQRITKISPFINSYNWKDINFPAGTDEYKIFERNNKNIALNIL